MPSALVTGAAGFVGSNLSTALLDRGYAVRGIDNFATGRRRNLEPLESRDGFTFREGDVRDAGTLREVAEGVDSVFHQAAVPSVPRSVDDPATSTRANCTGTATVLDVARTAGVDTVVVASSSSVYGSGGDLPKVETQPPDPESPYALTKYFTEKLALQASDLYDVDTVALRYFNVFGPRQDPAGAYAAVIPKFIRLMLEGERPVVYGDGEQSRDFTYVADAVAANVLAAEGDVTGEAFNVGRSSPTTINDLVAALNDLLETDLQPVHDDPRPGDVRHSHADVSKARELLGYEPAVALEDGLARTVDHLRQRTA